MKFGDQETFLKLIPNRETKIEIDAETPKTDAGRIDRGKEQEGERWEESEKQEWEQNGCGSEKCEEEAE